MGSIGHEACPCPRGPHSQVREIRCGHMHQNTKNQAMFPLPLCPKVLKTEACENAKQRNLLPKGGKPESLPGRGSLILPSLLLGPTGRTHLCAAKATAVETKVLRVSFPPKPPPILFTRTTIRFAGTPNMFATKLCVGGKKHMP